MTMQRPDFHYEIPDERLMAYSRIPLLDRLKWLDEVRRFTLAARAAPTVGRDAPVERAPKHQRGLTLIELIVFIVIVGVALAGVLTVLNHTTRHSADPLVRKQALAIAEALLEEVMLQPFSWCDPDDPQAATATSNAVGATGCSAAGMVEGIGPESGESRFSTTTPYDNVNDYVNADGTAISGNTFGLGDATNAIGNVVGNAFAPLGYTASIRVEQSSLNAIPVAASLLITVTVAAPGETIQVQGYRTRHSPNLLP